MSEKNVKDNIQEIAALLPLIRGALLTFDVSPPGKLWLPSPPFHYIPSPISSRQTALYFQTTRTFQIQTSMHDPHCRQNKWIKAASILPLEAIYTGISMISRCSLTNLLKYPLSNLTF